MLRTKVHVDTITLRLDLHLGTATAVLPGLPQQTQRDVAGTGVQQNAHPRVEDRGDNE